VIQIIETDSVPPRNLLHAGALPGSVDIRRLVQLVRGTCGRARLLLLRVGPPSRAESVLGASIRILGIGPLPEQPYRSPMPQDQQKKPVIPDEPARDDEAWQIAKDYADDQRAIIRKLRKLN
jgi:hypothetical protein